MNKFEISNLDLYYGQLHALKDVELKISERQITAFIGPSGCGKSTLLRTLNRMNDLVEGCHITGNVLLDGQDITRLPMYRRAILGLGYLPQETSIFRGLTVEKNIAAVLELVEPDKSARAARLDQLLDEFGLTRLRALGGDVNTNS